MWIRFTLHSKEYLISSWDCDPSVRARGAVFYFSFYSLPYPFLPPNKEWKVHGGPGVLFLFRWLQNLSSSFSDSYSIMFSLVLSALVRQMTSKSENAFLWNSMLHFYESLHLDMIFHNVFLKSLNLYSTRNHLLLL